MYIYHVLINPLSTHMIHINLNMIFYTHVERSPSTPTKTDNLHKVLYRKTNTHYTHTRSHTILWHGDG